MDTIYDKQDNRVTLYDLCHLIYQGFGQDGVVRFIDANSDLMPSTVHWDECGACEYDCPFDGTTCLVCGSEIDDPLED